MGNGLAGMRAAIVDHPIAFCQLFHPGNFPDGPKTGGQLSVRQLIGFRQRTDMLFRNDQNVGRHLRRDIPKRQDILILVHLVGGNFPFRILQNRQFSM